MKSLGAARVAAVLILIGLGVGGCYRKVVGANGFAADDTAVQRGNLPSDSGPRTLGYPVTQYKKLPGE